MKKRSIVMAAGFVTLLLFAGAGCSAYKASNTNVNAANATAAGSLNANNTLQVLNRNTITNSAMTVNTNLLDAGTVSVNTVQNTNSNNNADSGTAQKNNANGAGRALRAISLQNFAFTPADIDIKAGTTVTWTNLDGVAHTVTGDNGGPSSGTIEPQGTYSYTFSTAGTYAYHCAPHPYMTGTVTVTQ